MKIDWFTLDYAIFNQLTPIFDENFSFFAEKNFQKNFAISGVKILTFFKPTKDLKRKVKIGVGSCVHFSFHHISFDLA